MKLMNRGEHLIEAVVAPIMASSSFEARPQHGRR
jgi:hypothetical protein